MPIPGNLFTLPDVPLPKMKDLLSIVARPPQRSPRVHNGRSQTYQSYDSEQTTPMTEDKQFVNGDDQYERYESLPDQAQDYDNVSALVTGWGRNSSSGPKSNILQEATVTTMTNSQCRSSRHKHDRITENMICAQAAGRDACKGGHKE